MVKLSGGGGRSSRKFLRVRKAAEDAHLDQMMVSIRRLRTEGESPIVTVPHLVGAVTGVLRSMIRVFNPEGPFRHVGNSPVDVSNLINAIRMIVMLATGWLAGWDHRPDWVWIRRILGEAQDRLETSQARVNASIATQSGGIDSKGAKDQKTPLESAGVKIKKEPGTVGGETIAQVLRDYADSEEIRTKPIEVIHLAQIVTENGGPEVGNMPIDRKITGTATIVLTDQASEAWLLDQLLKRQQERRPE